MAILKVWLFWRWLELWVKLCWFHWGMYSMTKGKKNWKQHTIVFEMQMSLSGRFFHKPSLNAHLWSTIKHISISPYFSLVEPGMWKLNAAFVDSGSKSVNLWMFWNIHLALTKDKFLTLKMFFKKWHRMMAKMSDSSN